MFNHNVILRTKMMLLVGFLASGIFVLPGGAQAPATTPTPSAPAQSAAPAQPAASARSAATAQSALSTQSLAPTQSALTTRRLAAGAPSRYLPSRFSRRAGLYYTGFWGVDLLRVKYAESGEIIKFSYRVLDPQKAAVLNDKKAEPSLIDPKAGVKLVVPELEKVGKLRQSSTPIEGRIYWMAFSNKGRLVKPGDRVTVEIGPFRANGLVVE